MKLYKNIIIIVSILAVLVVAFVVVNNLPEEKNPTGDAEKNQVSEYVDVLRLNYDDIVKIQVKSQEDEFVILKDKDTISVNGLSDVKTHVENIKSFVKACSYIYAEKIVSTSSEDNKIYGFENPSATIIITLKDGTNKTVYIGDNTLDSSGSYLKLADEDKIYIKSAYGIKNLTPKRTDFISKDVLTINPKEYESLSDIKISKQNNTEIALKAVNQKDEEARSASWKMLKPVYADANTAVLSRDILTPLETFTADSVVEIKAKDLTKYGLDKPYATLTISADNITDKLIFGKEVDGYRFFKVGNFDTIYIVSEQKVSFLNVAYIDLMSRLIHLENIKEISTVEIVSPDKNFTLKILGEDRYINDKKVSNDVFTKIYQNIISISIDSVDLAAKPTSSHEVIIKYTKNDGSKCTVSFASISERNYLALVDGKGNSVVNKKSVKDVIKSIEEQIKN